MSYLNQFTSLFFVPGSSWLNSMSQSLYNHNGVYASPSITFSGYGQITSTASALNNCGDVWGVVTQGISAFGWSYDVNGIYLVVLAANVPYANQNACSYHTSTTIASTVYKYGLLYNQGACSIQGVWPVATVSAHVQSFPSALFHEVDVSPIHQQLMHARWPR